MFFPRRPMPPMQPPGFFGGPPRFPAQGMNRGGGGLLSRLLSGLTGGGRGTNPANFMQGPMNASQISRGITNPTTLQSLANPANLSSMLGNVQKVLNTAESVMPMVQQYGPLVKNLPGMIKLYKELNSADTSDDSEDEKKKTSEPETIAEVDVPKKRSKPTKQSPTKETKAKHSVPKLYI